ncbi:copper-binding protein [Citrobacter sp. FDAARGOS_156]|uniref:copper-binding protein n=1 Tax=Citrobacter sp. FDAARGOS_156 TaxID=1702170 RepID=UPI0018FF2E41|nr:copper-binding protein [Citrobacter sp. FDAARGOS_156]MBJ8888949.1 copper-binding protein [Citrobacter sp. FDAARGOS_156]
MNKISSFLAIAFFISAGANAAETSTTHQQATVAHEMMNNSDAPAHQKMAQTHEVQVQNSQSTRASALSFSQMNEHEKAMVVHQSMNNSHSYSHELQAKKHREQAATQG